VPRWNRAGWLAVEDPASLNRPGALGIAGIAGFAKLTKCGLGRSLTTTSPEPFANGRQMP
jgi:hypothetical protein